MNRVDIRVSKEELKKIFKRVDKNNYMDFSTLEALIKAEFGSKDLAFELSDYLETELGFTCDADLSDITGEEIEDIIEVINSIEE